MIQVGVSLGIRITNRAGWDAIGYRILDVIVVILNVLLDQWERSGGLSDVRRLPVPVMETMDHLSRTVRLLWIQGD